MLFFRGCPSLCCCFSGTMEGFQCIAKCSCIRSGIVHGNSVSLYLNPLPTIRNSQKLKSLYKVLTPSNKPPCIFLWAYGSSWRIYASLVGKGITESVCPRGMFSCERIIRAWLISFICGAWLRYEGMWPCVLANGMCYHLQVYKSTQSGFEVIYMFSSEHFMLAWVVLILPWLLPMGSYSSITMCQYWDNRLIHWEYTDYFTNISQ